MKNMPPDSSEASREPVNSDSNAPGPRTCQAALLRLDEAVDRFNSKLAEIEARCSGTVSDPDGLFRTLSDAIHEMVSSCEEFEKSSPTDRTLLKDIRKRVREKTDRYFLQSRLMRHARTWPRGYPGDYMILEGIYDNTPDSEGIGYYLDRYFLSTILAKAVRGRKETMRHLLSAELVSRKGADILNIGCGSCREIGELAREIISSGSRVICLDMDEAALDSCRNRALRLGLGPDIIKFRRYNALKMVDHGRNLREFGMQDIVYSIGLFDYLKNEILVLLIGFLYKLIRPGGKLIFSIKDSDRYKPQEYHWLVDWDSFLQRTSDEHLSLIENAGLSVSTVLTLRDPTGVIVFYVVGR